MNFTVRLEKLSPNLNLPAWGGGPGLGEEGAAFCRRKSCSHYLFARALSRNGHGFAFLSRTRGIGAEGRGGGGLRGSLQLMKKQRAGALAAAHVCVCVCARMCNTLTHECMHMKV